MAIGPSGRNPSGSPQVSFRLSKASGSVKSGRALANRPRVILGDEPTGNLDTQTGAEILTLVHDLHSRLGATVLIVTHDASVAESCPRNLELRDGRIVGDRRR